ncbi:MAG: hypothetical protein A3J65_02135 [Candidatus Buchananbacteria bacterium RIFCSPHIGHO2_02_FULL_45_11b]|uniref:Cytidyltransferase-like domain-containing protein n=1 Tax=Candidatus Buchananbacteria bacterium RIFCSPHIGHO2_02_FULL_45_11b TaxID=1797541 RepID=A0A1G1YKF9_9BACT|nr:MAG: hypothetical protein A3J65_02135 [Candidatus Buchananbacteria bacterium RIFCSPHIGHO2_02_FULL_45_11b]
MKKVMAFGTFDGLHPGHLNFLKQARRLGDSLVVVVARDANVRKIKGRFSRLGEGERLRKVKRAMKRWGYKAVLGGLKDPYVIIRKEKPGVIALGYDQKSFDRDLKKKFPKIKIARLKPYQANIYKSSKLIKRYAKK